VAPLVRQLREVSLDLGWRRALRLAPRWLVHRRYLTVVSDLGAWEPDLGRPADVSVRRLRDADVPALAALDPAMTAEAVARRLEDGQQCTLGWWNGELAHYRWVSALPVHLPYLGKVLRPLPGDQIVVGIHTAPALRGRRIAHAVMMADIARARAAGVTRLVWLVAWWNARSLGLADQCQARVVGTVGYWALGRRRRYFATGDARLEPHGVVVAAGAGGPGRDGDARLRARTERGGRA
jgi:GNAT superfamily N-acetyltransferase